METLTNLSEILLPLLAFKISVARQEMQSNYNKKKCCFEGCIGEMNDGGGVRMPQKEICL